MTLLLIMMIQNVANTFGVVRDPAVRFNFALFDASPWTLGPLTDNPVGP
jgi:hypothetical protein